MKRDAHAFTIIELLAAMLAASVLALTAGLMLLVSYRTWVDNNDYVDLQRDASLAQSIVDRWVREASHWNVTATNGVLTMLTETGSRRLYRDSANLIYDPDTGTSDDEMVVSSNRVTEFTAEATHLGVAIDLWLQEEEMTAELHTFISFRN